MARVGRAEDATTDELRWTQILQGLWPSHLECAVIVFAGVGGKEIGGVGVAFIMVNAAGEPAEIRSAGEREAICCRLGFQRDSVTEAKDFHILRMETCAVHGIIGPGDHTAQLTGMTIGVAVPGALPAALQACVWGRSRSGHFPFLIEAAATAAEN